MKKTAYENYCLVRDKLGYTDYKVAKETGIGTATMSNWKNGKYIPKTDKIQKIADFLGVTTDYLMTGTESNELIYTCTDCGLSYVATDYEDTKHHIEIHEAWKAAEDKFGRLYCYRPKNEEIKHRSQTIRNNKNLSRELRFNAVIEILKCYFSDSVSASNFNLHHVPFKEYVAMLMNGEKNRQIIASDLASDIIHEYGTLPGIKDGERYYQIPSTLQNQCHTIAAHFDGTEYTEEQLDRIKAFAAFIKSEGQK